MQKFAADILQEQAAGRPAGIASICSSSVEVLESVLAHADSIEGNILIEATCNQVNQFGGYTGRTPDKFCSWILEMAEEYEVKRDKLKLGGDHLGVVPFQDEPAAEAMKKGRQMAYDYARAGFDKLHLDASPPLADDSLPLPVEKIAARTAELCQAAEKGFAEGDSTGEIPPNYVVGSEVPSPGGDENAESGKGPVVTELAELQQSLEAMEKAFQKRDLEDAWERVMAFVVQPGVEFASFEVFDYWPEDFEDLSDFISRRDDLVFEGHSTDYQTPEALKRMVADGTAILKVGPGLTFVLREALFALEAIVKELSWQLPEGDEKANFSEILLAEMKQNPESWQGYYQGSREEIELACRYSYFDRSRYYLSRPAVKKARERLKKNFDRLDVPPPLLRQYLPEQYRELRRGEYKMKAENLIKSAVFQELKPYLRSTGQLKE
ncbi:class II D-tagatose-bisphosphate aldolase non-catalytic subunit [Halarsenatibacter silvermanii]|uniref:Tagatose-bisphosphate aldolase noncatalytic subunit n=1 Tax=Halarsenatibacter silvermanii TaxID=321763 RepID=A0A1G9LZD5_9FIRM|nr:class II D-tagatose-bisphosphate aldolase, non-catalytic subunit [Halarsenatibacter silvermanii]SDL67348.1 tagatose-bisphosphate aldolase noncatalytic subunit [Halarsenatibacter silvermanii]